MDYYAFVSYHHPNYGFINRLPHKPARISSRVDFELNVFFCVCQCLEGHVTNIHQPQYNVLTQVAFFQNFPSRRSVTSSNIIYLSPTRLVNSGAPYTLPKPLRFVSSLPPSPSLSRKCIARSAMRKVASRILRWRGLMGRC